MQPSPAPSPRPPRRRRTLLAAAVGAAAVVAAAVTAVVLLDDGPERTVERYLTALLDGDAEAALAEAAPQELPETEEEAVFLVEDAMRADWSFDAIASAEGPEPWDRSVTVELTGFGRTEQARFELEDTDEGWKIRNPFAWVVFERSSLMYMDMEGIRVADPEPEYLWPRPVYPVFPGTHRFFTSLPDDLVPSDPESFERLLTPESRPTEEGEGWSPAIEVSVRGELLEQARAQITELIDDCAATGEPDPRLTDRADSDGFCPFTMQTAYEFDDGSYLYLDDPQGGVEWTVTEYPEFALADPPGLSPEHEQGFRGVEAVVEREGSISATVDVLAYETATSRGTVQQLNFECVFAPGGFRGVVGEDDAIAMYFFSSDAESGRTVLSLSNEDCTDDFDEPL